MQKENKYTSRSAFLKKASLAIVSVFGLGIAGLSLQKLNPFSANRVNSLSKNEANEIIKGMKSINVTRIKPEEPPKRNSEQIASD